MFMRIKKWIPWFLIIGYALILNAVTALPAGFASEKTGIFFLPAPSAVVILWLIILAAFMASLIKKVLLLSASAVWGGIFLLTGMGEAITRFFYEREFQPRCDFFFVLDGLKLVTQNVGDTRAWPYVVIVLLVCLVPIGLLFYIHWLIVNRIKMNKQKVFITAAVIFSIISCAGMIWVSPPTGMLLYNRLQPPNLEFDNAVTDNGKAGKKAAGDIDGQKKTNPGLLPAEGASKDPGSSTTSEQNPDKKIITGFPLLQEGGKAQDVYFIIVESYGAIILDDPDFQKVFKPRLKSFETKLKNAGFLQVSRFFTSPVKGGFSWLADSSMMTGLNINLEEKYAKVLESSADSLPRIFKRKGYTSILIAPGNAYGDWPEGRRFYGYDNTIVDGDFGYKGPDFCFVPVPDQFALYTVNQYKNQHADKRPFFFEIVLVSGHSPYSKIPAYIPSWQMGDGSILDKKPIRTFDNTWVSGSEYREGFQAAMEYDMDTIFGFIETYVDSNDLIIVIGDHQPPRPVAERGASWDVIGHVITGNKKIIRNFTKKGYNEGLIPERKTKSVPIRLIYSHLLDSISGHKKE